MRRPVIAFLLSLTMLLTLAGCSSRGSYAFKGGEIKNPTTAPALTLMDQDGNSFSLDQVKGQVVVVYFGYTTCPDLCPTTLSDFTAIRTTLGDKSGRVRFVLVTVDPERDTPARLKQYLNFFDPTFIGLTGSQEQLTPVERGYGVVAKRVEHPGSKTGYLMDHSSLIYVIDAKGRLKLTYGYGTDPAVITDDVRHLL
jgi:protein SCO1/2